MKKDLIKVNKVEVNEEKRLGNMRIDWYDGRLANQWNPTNLLIEMNNSREINLKELQKELNYIQFELLERFDKVKKYCNGTGYDKESLFAISLSLGEYLIKLIPSVDDYSYIYVYLK